jgi:putative SOS response-associated peptidase YedK
MCGRFTLTRSAAEVAEHFGLVELPPLAPRYNVAPGQAVAVVRRPPRSEAPWLELRRWGLIPHFARTASGGLRAINARIETAATRPAFRGALRRRRCLVPADGFYEWGPAGARQRRPHWIALEGGVLFAMAGLYETWRAPDGAELETCAVITTEAEGAVRALHPRMPLLLAPEAYAAWLDPARGEDAVAEALGRTAPARRLVARRVGARVNDPRHDAPDCLAPDPEEVLPLFDTREA